MDAMPMMNTVEYGSDLIAEALREQGFPYICLNPGASYRGLHDSLVNYLGNRTPEIITCMHEEHAVGLAQGYAKVTDKALAVAVHSNVGLMHATMGIFDAWCDRAPMVVIGATGPIDATQRRPWIEWVHTTNDQGGLVRGYTKWDDQPGSAQAAVEAIRRGTMMANSRPCGPVYINLDVTIQEEKQDGRPPLEDVSLFATPEDTEPAPASLARAVEILRNAKRPFVFAGRGLRSDEAWADRIRLVELLGARCATHVKLAAAFPTTHPAFAGETGWRLKGKMLEETRAADAILLLDWLDPGNSLRLAFPPGEPRPPVINVSNDVLIHRGWVMDYGGATAADVTLQTVPETSVRRMVEIFEAERPKAPKQTLKGFDVPKVEGKGEIGLVNLARAFHHASKDYDISITARPIGWPMNANEIDHPLGFLGFNGGGGIGSGPSITVGVALALRDIGAKRIPVGILGDGDYTMGVSAIWNAATLKLPVLFVIANNHSYFNDEDHQAKVARHRGRNEANAPIGQRMQNPEPDLPTIARGFGLEAPDSIRDLAELPAALELAFKRVSEGASYLLDVQVHPEYIEGGMVDVSVPVKK